MNRPKHRKRTHIEPVPLTAELVKGRWWLGDPSVRFCDIGPSQAPTKLEGLKYDTDKCRLELVDDDALEGLGWVLTYGARKYAPDNWRKGLEWQRLIGAARRHLAAFARGEDTDPESGLPHIDHAQCCLMMLSAFQKQNGGLDDRCKTSGSASSKSPLPNPRPPKE